MKSTWHNDNHIRVEVRKVALPQYLLAKNENSLTVSTNLDQTFNTNQMSAKIYMIN